MYHCTVCGQPFEYGDKWSPVFNDELWNNMLDFYGLKEHEISAEVLFNYYYDLWKETDDEKYEDLAFQDNCHTWICYKCAEKYLGRKLKKSDLIAENVPLNRDFEEFYFNE